LQRQSSLEFHYSRYRWRRWRGWHSCCPWLSNGRQTRPC